MPFRRVYTAFLCYFKVGILPHGWHSYPWHFSLSEVEKSDFSLFMVCTFVVLSNACKSAKHSIIMKGKSVLLC